MYNLEKSHILSALQEGKAEGATVGESYCLQRQASLKLNFKQGCF